jgi:hypothetical protein
MNTLNSVAILINLNHRLEQVNKRKVVIGAGVAGILTASIVMLEISLASASQVDESTLAKTNSYSLVTARQEQRANVLMKARTGRKQDAKAISGTVAMRT